MDSNDEFANSLVENQEQELSEVHLLQLEVLKAVKERDEALAKLGVNTSVPLLSNRSALSPSSPVPASLLYGTGPGSRRSPLVQTLRSIMTPEQRQLERSLISQRRALEAQIFIESGSEIHRRKEAEILQDQVDQVKRVWAPVIVPGSTSTASGTGGASASISLNMSPSNKVKNSPGTLSYHGASIDLNLERSTLSPRSLSQASNISNNSGYRSYLWVPAEIINVAEEHVTVRKQDTLRSHMDILLSELLPMNPLKQAGIADSSRLEHINTPGIVENLHQRLDAGHHVSRSGPVLVSCGNSSLHGRFGIEDHEDQLMVRTYCNEVVEEMRRTGKSQSIIISGESGSGKDLMTHAVMSELISSNALGSSSHNNRRLASMVTVGQRLLNSFCCAKVRICPSSSRYVGSHELQYSADYNIVGCNFSLYHFEVDRVIGHSYFSGAPGFIGKGNMFSVDTDNNESTGRKGSKIKSSERNFHIFYQLCANASSGSLCGVSPSVNSRLLIRSAEEFRYLFGEPSTPDDLNAWSSTLSAMSAIGMSQDDIDGVVRSLAAILHLGQLQLKVSSKGIGPDAVHAVKAVANLLDVDATSLFNALSLASATESRTHGGFSSSAGGATAASNPRLLCDSLAVSIYCRLLTWITERINLACSPCSTTPLFVINVLDVMGIEDNLQCDSRSKSMNSDKVCNGWPQFVRNVVNEKLSQFMCTVLFERERELYRQEGIVTMSTLELPMSHGFGVTNLMERKGGLMSLLEDEESVPTLRVDSFLAKLANRFGEHPGYSHCHSTNSFILRHGATAGNLDIMYNAQSIVSAVRWGNSGEIVLSTNIVSLLNDSRCALIKLLFPYSVVKYDTRSSSESRSLLGSTACFKNHMAELMRTVSSTGAHFIKCIKVSGMSGAAGGWCSTSANIINSSSYRHLGSYGPGCSTNSLTDREDMDVMYVARQIEGHFILDTIKWWRFGYPCHFSFKIFYHHYKGLRYKSTRSLGKPSTDSSYRNACEDLFDSAPFEKHHWQIGESMVFCRSAQLEILNSILQERLDLAAVKVASVFKCMHHRLNYRASMIAFKTIGLEFRATLARQRFNEYSEQLMMDWQNSCSQAYSEAVDGERRRELREQKWMTGADSDTSKRWLALTLEIDAQDKYCEYLAAEDAMGHTMRAVWNLRDLEKRQKIEKDSISCRGESFKIKSPDLQSLDGESAYYAMETNKSIDSMTGTALKCIDNEIENAEVRYLEWQAELRREEGERWAMSRIEIYHRSLESSVVNRVRLSSKAEHWMMAEEEANQVAFNAMKHIDLAMKRVNRMEVELQSTEPEPKTLSNAIKKISNSTENLIDSRVNLKGGATAHDEADKQRDEQFSSSLSQWEKSRRNESTACVNSIVDSLLTGVVRLCSADAFRSRGGRDPIMEAIEKRDKEEARKREILLEKEREALRLAEEKAALKRAKREALEKEKADKEAARKGDGNRLTDRIRRDTSAGIVPLVLSGSHAIDHDLASIKEWIDSGLSDSKQHYDTKFLHKYKYRALVVGDDFPMEELERLGGGKNKLSGMEHIDLR